MVSNLSYKYCYSFFVFVFLSYPVFLMVVKDIFSLKKEIRDGTVSNTIIFMCLHGTVESLQVAVDRVIQLREEAER